MANKKLTDLTAATTLSSADLFYVVQSGVSKKSTLQKLLDLIGVGGGGGGGGTGLTVVSTRTALANLDTTLKIAFLSEAGREGFFLWNSSNLATMVTADPAQGMYVATSAHTDGSSGAWVRTNYDAYNVKWWGAKGDGTTDDGPAFSACLNFMEATAVNDLTTVYRGAPELHIPAGHYWLNTTTLDFFTTIRVRGDGTGYAGDAGIGTRLRWAEGTTGIRVQVLNTTGAGSIRANGHAGDGCIFEGLFLGSAYTATTIAGETEAHAFHLKGRAVIRDCAVRYFPGDGIHIVAYLGSGGAFEGNANLSYIERCTIEYCRNGLYLDGDNTNACYTLGLNCSYNRQWGIYDSSFLGNTHTAFHLDSNAGLTLSGSDGSNMGSYTMAHLSGHIYACIPGQESWCSTHAPSGTTAHNQGWFYHADGSVGNYNARAWVSGMTWRSGGAMCTDNANAPHIVTGYAEGGQPPSYMGVGLLIGGEFANAVYAYGVDGTTLRPFPGQFVSDGGGFRSVASVKADRNLVAGGLLAIDGGASEVFGYTYTLSKDTNNGMQFFPRTGGAIYDIMFIDGVGNQAWGMPTGTKDFKIINGALRLKVQAASSVATPDGGYVNLFIDSADNLLKTKNSSGTVTAV
jgi:hypothetical protein